MAINGKTKNVVKGLVTSSSTTEANFKVGLDDIIEAVDIAGVAVSVDKSASFTLDPSEASVVNVTAASTVTIPTTTPGAEVVITDTGDFITWDGLEDNALVPGGGIPNHSGSTIYNLIGGATKWYLYSEQDGFSDYTLQVPITRGVFAGGYNPNGSTRLVNISYITISTLGNAEHFGALTTATGYMTGVNSSSRGVFAGGSTGVLVNTIEYITIATLGGAMNFGNLVADTAYMAGVSSSSRGVFAGGYDGSSIVDSIEYITIASLGDASSFGNLTGNRYTFSGTGNGVRGVFAGGYDSGTSATVKTIEYITIATLGDATDFGDLTTASSYGAATSNGTRGVFALGDTGVRVNSMEYIAIETLGNATDFGDLTVARSTSCAVSNGTDDRGVFGSGRVNVGSTNTMDYITISSIGNATDFGDLNYTGYAVAATQGA